MNGGNCPDRQAPTEHQPDPRRVHMGSKSFRHVVPKSSDASVRPIDVRMVRAEIRLDDVADPATAWLLESDEPATRYRTRTWLLDRPETDRRVRADRRAIAQGQIVSALLDFPAGKVHPYAKWHGVHWRLVSLADLELPTDDAGVRSLLDEGIERELTWIAKPARLDAIPRLDGLYRSDASMEGNAVHVASRFGRADDERVRRLVDRLLAWQWPDGGWNCDRRASGYRSSFHESWAPTIGLATYHRATGDTDALAAARRAAELLLEHRLVRVMATGKPIHPSFTALHWPAYWHYDLLAGLRVLATTGQLGDERATDALDRLVSLRRPDGRFQANATWWRPAGAKGGPPDVVDWGRGRPSESLTLHALRVLKAADRWP